MRHDQVVLIAIVAVLLAGCAHDRRGLVATKTLLDAQGAFDQATLGAAIRAKFPPGSPLDGVLGYVRETKGDCKSEGRALRCEIPYRGGFCWAQMIGIDIETEASAVKDIKVHVGGLGC